MTVATLKEVAQKLGVSENQIRQYKNAFLGMAGQNGVFVDIHIGRFYGKVQLSDDDLGIELTKEEEKYVSLGHQKLLPPEILNKAARIEHQGRHNVEKNAFRLMSGLWVPVTAWDNFNAENERLKGEFFKVRDEICSRYDELIAAVKEDFAEQAKAVYERLERKPEDRRKWIRDYVDRLVARIPKKERIHADFYWEMELEWLPSPSTIEEERLRMDKVAAARRKIDAEQKKMFQEQRMAAFSEEDRRQKIEEMNRLIAEQHRRQQERIAKERETFLEQVILQLRQALYHTARQVLVSMKRNDGKLLGANAKALENLIERGRMLNFHNDKEVEAFYAEIEKHIRRDPNRRSTTNIKRLMEEIERTIGDSVRLIEKQDTKEEEIIKIMGGDDLISRVRTVE